MFFHLTARPAPCQRNDESKTPDPIPPENRRTFIKKSVATSVSVSFVGLIRAAHGEGGGQTTTWNPENTSVTTNYGGSTTFNPMETSVTTNGTSTTWNPEETTVTTTYDPLVCIEKHKPVGGDPPEGLPPGFHENAFRTRTDVRPGGHVKITRNGVDLFELTLEWRVVVSEIIVFDEPPPLVSVDCVSYSLSIDIGMELDVLNAVAHQDIDQNKDDLLAEISAGRATALGVNPPENVIFPWIEVSGPKIRSAYSVSAGYGFDMADLSQLKPIVNVGGRLGKSSESSHGYWAKVKSDVSINPSRTVNFQWTPEIRRSTHINIEKHIGMSILQRVMWLGAQIKPVFDTWIIEIEIEPLPEFIGYEPFEQLVVALELPPESPGQSCELMDPMAYGAEVDEPPVDEPIPNDDQWEKEDPEFFERETTLGPSEA